MVCGDKTSTRFGGFLFTGKLNIFRQQGIWKNKLLTSNKMDLTFMINPGIVLLVNEKGTQMTEQQFLTVCMTCFKAFPESQMRQPKNTRLAPKCKGCASKRR